MTTVTFCVSTIDEAKRRLSAAMSGLPQAPRIGFSSYARLHGVLTPKRVDLLKALMGQGPLGIRELSRITGRDKANIHEDIELLVKAGVISRVQDKAEFPYEDFEIEMTASLDTVTA